MVKFGKEFRLVQKEEWKGKYLNYKKLKQYINCYVSQEYLQTKSLPPSEFELPAKKSKSEIEVGNRQTLHRAVRPGNQKGLFVL